MLLPRRCACRIKYSRALLVVALLGAGSVQAQLVDVTACRAIADTLARFDCYESAESGSPAIIENQSQPNSSANPAASATSGVSVDPESEPRSLLDRGRELPLVGRLLRGAREDDTAPELAQEAPGAATLDPADFGRPRSATIQATESGQPELHDTISALDKNNDGNWRITLSGGQVWQQVYVKRYLLKAGQEVRIYPSGWGKNYRLEAKGRAGFLQVRRVDVPN